MAILTQTKLSAADHNFTKLSITPSISLFVKFSDNPIQSFYAKQVYISLKDATFQASFALRHATKFYDSIGQYYLSTNSLPEIVIIYTNRGPDHRYSIHKEAQKNSILKYELQISIDKIQNILFDQIRLLKLHDDYFEINNPASEKEIDKFFEVIFFYLIYNL
ncbi:hypothetical protein C2G38_2166040 [Gigaspora rosea]|uniref:Uncharacterized protein n=1 Tax=Gigaspora rosea TaxID=44941 RepID=A0A397VTY2_9GLOM|nr:hypothetical protein C2G38_2166040 [Gigaspora rosea]